jgi:hypothetical protein
MSRGAATHDASFNPTNNTSCPSVRLSGAWPMTAEREQAHGQAVAGEAGEPGDDQIEYPRQPAQAIRWWSGRGR